MYNVLYAQTYFCFKKAFPVFFVILLCLFTACTPRENDYTTILPQSVFRGVLKDGRMVYLTRENDSVNLSGTWFVNKGEAVADVFQFDANVSGDVLFNIKSKDFKGKISFDPLNHSLKVSIPSIPEYGIKKQKVVLVPYEQLIDVLACVERYKEPVFDSIIAYRNIQYGTAMGHYTSQPVDSIPHGDIVQLRNLIIKDIGRCTQKRVKQPLYMDIYEPYSDELEKRPLVVFVHGGAFFFGDKENLLQRTLTDDLVKKGYVVASINYRLGSTLMGTKAVERTIYKGVKDVRAALRFLMHNSEQYRIDPEQVYLSGSSAGGILALTTAFMEEDEVFESVDRRIKRNDLGRLNQSGNDLDDSFKIAGIISMWGGMVSPDIIDERNAHIPVLLFHGTKDDIVNAVSGLPFDDKIESRIYQNIADSWKIHGSVSVRDHMQEHGMPVKCVLFEGYGHEPQVEKDGSYNDNIFTILDETGDFLYANLSDYSMLYAIEGNSSVSRLDEIPVYTVSGPGNGMLVDWKVDGGLIIGQTDYAVQVIWYDLPGVGKINACITDEKGVSCIRQLEVEINTDSDALIPAA